MPGAALLTRFVLRPLIREVTDAIRSLRTPTDDGALRQRIAELEEGQKLLEGRMAQLTEAEAFHRELKAGASQD